MMEEEYRPLEMEDSEGSDREWKEESFRFGEAENEMPRRSMRNKRRVSKFNDDSYVIDDEETKAALSRKRKYIDELDRIRAQKKKLKKAKKRKAAKREKLWIDSSGDEGVLIIDDPNSYYDTDEYDSDGKVIKREELKRQQLQEERLQRKLKRKPNTPHLVKKYTPVPMEKDGKTPIFPIQLRKNRVGSTEISRKEVYSSAPSNPRYIWPVGFKSSRIYSSMTSLDKKCEYTSEIVDNGDEPSFIVTCWEDASNPMRIVRPTASGAWAEVGKRFFELKKEVTGKDTFTQLSGPEMFGFAHPSIAKLIQEMPGAKKCEKYVTQQFVPSTAKIRMDEPRTRRSSKRKSKKKDSASDSDSDEDDDEEIVDAKEFEAEDAYDIKDEEADRTPKSTRKRGLRALEKLDDEEEEVIEESGGVIHSQPSTTNGQASMSKWTSPIGGSDDEEVIEESGGVV